jgi:hypothetical protein
MPLVRHRKLAWGVHGLCGFTLLQGRLRRHHEGLGGCLSHASREPGELCRGLAFAGPNELEQLPVAGSLRGLPDERPDDVALAGQQIEVVEIAEESETPFAPAAEALAVEPLGHGGRALPVSRCERAEPLGVPVALAGELSGT